MRQHPFALALTAALCALSLVCVLSVQADGIVYVNRAATGANNGSSWSDAYTSLGVALSNTLRGEVWVAQGAYTPTVRSDPADPRSVTYVLTDSLALYGGFAGTETTREQRDWRANETILSGDLLGDDVGLDLSRRGDNARHVVTARYVDASSRLDGFTIRDGQVSDSQNWNEGGGGLCCVYANPTVANCTFAENRSDVDAGGGGLFTFGSSPTLTDCIFQDNSGRRGGGLSNRYYGNPMLVNVLLAHNQAYQGGAVYNFDASPTLINVTIVSNVSGEGGAISNWFDSVPVLRNCIVWGNGDKPFYSYYCVRWPIAYSLVQGGCPDGAYASCERVLRDDPLFRDPEHGDYALLPTSPAIDAGSDISVTVATDLAGHPRVGGPHVDMGALESEPGVGVHKVVTPTLPLHAGDALTYTITIVNTGLQAAGGLIVTDVPPAQVSQLTYQTSGIVVTPTGPTAYSWQVSELGPGARGVITVCGVITPTSSSYELVTNTAIVTSTLVPDRITTNNVSSVAVHLNGLIYVRRDAPAGGDGRGWGTAFQRVQDALGAARAGDEIWVATGVYTPTTPAPKILTSNPLEPHEVCFRLVRGVALYGGFAGHEVDRAQRDWDAHPTVLSGDLLGNDAGSVATTNPSRRDNAYHVVVAESPDESTILDGFIISRGNGVSGMRTCRGSGLYQYQGTLTLRNLVLRDNASDQEGGGMFVHWGNALLSRVTFEHNVSADSGGAAAASQSCLTCEDCTFVQNVAGSGGAIGMDNHVYLNAPNGNLSLTRCVFRDNAGRGEGGALFTWGPVVLQDVLFEGNSAQSAGAYYAAPSEAPLRASHVVFRNNTASADGGALYLAQGSPTLASVSFIGNSAGRNGGALWVVIGNPLLVNGVFYGNSANGVGGAIYNKTSAYEHPSPTLVNCTLGGNTAAQGGAIWSDAGSGATVRNSILWGDAGGEINPDAGGTSLSFSLVGGGCPTGAGCDHLLDTDPLLRNPANGDYRLLPGSPAIDAGNDAYVAAPTDLDGQPRIVGEHVDMGAYEAMPDLAISQAVSPNRPLTYHDALTFTLRFANTGSYTATGVLITDIVPAELAGVACASAGVPLNAMGDVPFVWRVADMAPASAGVITVTGQLRPDLVSPYSFVNAASIASQTPDQGLTNNEARAWLLVGRPVWLPLVWRRG